MSSTLTATPSQPYSFARTLRIHGVPAPWRDSAVIFAIIVATTILCVRFDVSEMLRRWTAPWEGVQLDELPGILLVLAITLVWFAARRYREAARELARRCLAEERVATALATNRRLAQQYVRLQESERKALAQELHDELGQYLNVIKLDAVGIRDDRLEGAEAPRARAADIVENCDHIHHVLAALIRQLRPLGLDELGLPAALEHCVDTWQARLLDTELELSVTGDFAQLPESTSLTVYRLVQEALTNVAKHAVAEHVTIELARGTHDEGSPPGLRVMITDDGLGVDLTTPTRGLGLIGMRERVAALAGSLEVTSSPGHGFQLRAAIPLVSSC
jgi:two-component system, NarL family, sensor histidine kinase UhpB